ncbi:MAG TPA: hypothetical protein DCG47_12845, partial [Spirochaetaceae bacterium]|nr:hypothetical protein [Spirochaetaceae bacterium]
MKLKPSRSIIAAVSLAFGLVLSSCASGGAGARDYSGTFIGYAWKDEAKGVSLENATEKVQTTLVLDRKGFIKEASLDFLVLKNGEWTSRLAEAESVSIDYSVSPMAAVADPYKAGVSMFKVQANDVMSLYAVGVAADGTVAGFIVDPMTRFQFEFKFLPGFDFNRPVSILTIESGLFVPTARSSSGGLMKPKSWTALAGQSIFDYSPYSHVLNLRGDFSGLSSGSSIAELLVAMGVLFDGPRAKAMAPVFGYTGQGGWAGNYAAIEEFLVGKNARDLSSLIDWSNAR